MSSVSVTYRAPKGDNKVCEWGAFTFFDGVPQDVEETEQTAHMLKKMAGNSSFEVGKATGAKVKPREARVPIDEQGLPLQWRGLDRAVLLFSDLADVQAKAPALRSVLTQWIAATQ